MKSSWKAPTLEREGSALQVKARQKSRLLYTLKNKRFMANFVMRLNKRRYTCEINSQAKCISQKVNHVKRENSANLEAASKAAAA